SRDPSLIRRHPAVMDADSPLEYVGRVSQWRVPVEGGFTTISESTSVVNPPSRAGRADRRWVCDTPGAKSVLNPPGLPVPGLAQDPEHAAGAYGRVDADVVGLMGD